MRTAVILVFAIAAVPALAHPVTGIELEPRGVDGEQQLLPRDPKIHINWGKVGKTILGVAKAFLFRRDPEALLNPRNFIDGLDIRDFDEDLEARDFDDSELGVRDFDDELEVRDFDDDELEARDFDDELEARDFDDDLEARDFEDDLEARDFEDDLEARDFDVELETRGAGGSGARAS